MHPRLAANGVLLSYESLISKLGIHVQPSGEGFAACAGKNYGADFWVGGEGGEERWEFEPHWFDEGVEFVGAGYFDMGDERGWEGCGEVFGGCVGGSGWGGGCRSHAGGRGERLRQLW